MTSKPERILSFRKEEGKQSEKEKCSEQQNVYITLLILFYHALETNYREV